MALVSIFLEDMRQERMATYALSKKGSNLLAVALGGGRGGSSTSSPQLHLEAECFHDGEAVCTVHRLVDAAVVHMLPSGSGSGH